MEISRIVLLTAAFVLVVAAVGIFSYQSISSLGSEVEVLEATRGIGPGAVTAEKIATGAVETEKISDSAVTTAKLGDMAITSAKLAADTILAADIAAGAVNTSELATGAVTSAKIADGTIETEDIKDSAVTSAKIADGSISTVDLGNNVVTSGKLADEIVLENLSASLLVAGPEENNLVAKEFVVPDRLAWMSESALAVFNMQFSENWATIMVDRRILFGYQHENLGDFFHSMEFSRDNVTMDNVVLENLYATGTLDVDGATTLGGALNIQEGAIKDNTIENRDIATGFIQSGTLGIKIDPGNTENRWYGEVTFEPAFGVTPVVTVTPGLTDNKHGIVVVSAAASTTGIEITIENLHEVAPTTVENINWIAMVPKTD